MPEVSILSNGDVPEGEIKYAIIASRYRGLWIFVRQRVRDTWEIPGGHVEAGESVREAAVRELKEETGAKRFEIRLLAYYSVSDGDYRGYGSLFLADVSELGLLPEDSEIGEVMFAAEMPERLTHAAIQPALFSYACSVVSG